MWCQCMSKKDHPILAVAEGRYDLNKVCPKCGKDFIKKIAEDSSIGCRCLCCNYRWTSEGVDKFPVEKPGELYLQFVQEQADLLLEQGMKPQDVLWFNIQMLARNLTGVHV